MQDPSAEVFRVSFYKVTRRNRPSNHWLHLSRSFPLTSIHIPRPQPCLSRLNQSWDQQLVCRPSHRRSLHSPRAVQVLSGEA